MQAAIVPVVPEVQAEAATEERVWMVQPMSQILADIAASKPKNNVRVHKSRIGHDYNE